MKSVLFTLVGLSCASDDLSSLLQNKLSYDEKSWTALPAGGCQKVLDQCTTSQKMPLVGDLITQTFQDCVQTFSKVKSRNMQGLIQEVSQTTCSSQEVTHLWRKEQQFARSILTDESLVHAAESVVLVDSQEVGKLEEFQDSFESNPTKTVADCQHGLSLFQTIVDEGVKGGFVVIADLPTRCSIEEGNADGICRVSDKRMEVWRVSEVLQLLALSREVCACVSDSEQSLMQISSGSSTHAQVKAAFEVSAEHLQTISGFYERSATAFDNFVEKFSWLPQSMTQKLRTYNADRHTWANEMAKSGRTMQTCRGSSAQSLLQSMESTSSCLRLGLSKADQAAAMAVADATQMSEIVAEWSQYVPLCGAFVQFAKDLPNMYEGLQTSIQAATEKVEPQNALLQVEADEAFGLELQRVNNALNVLNQGLVSLSRGKI